MGSRAGALADPEGRAWWLGPWGGRLSPFLGNEATEPLTLTSSVSCTCCFVLGHVLIISWKMCLVFVSQPGKAGPKLWHLPSRGIHCRLELASCSSTGVGCGWGLWFISPPNHNSSVPLNQSVVPLVPQGPIFHCPKGLLDDISSLQIAHVIQISRSEFCFTE